MKKLLYLFGLAAALSLAGCDLSGPQLRIGTIDQLEVCSDFIDDFDRDDAALPAAPVLREVPVSSGAAALRLLDRGLIDLALVKYDTLLSALRDKRKSEDNDVVYAALAGLFDLNCHVLVQRNSGIEDLDDLFGKKLVMGRLGSGEGGTAVNLLKASGIELPMVTVDEVDLETGARLLQQGKIDALFINDQVPSAAVSGLCRSTELRLLGLDEDVKQNLLRYEEGYRIRSVAPGTYEGQEEAVELLSSQVVLMASQAVSRQDAHRVLERLFALGAARQHKDVQRPAHSEGTDLGQGRPVLESLSAGELNLSFHPGAADFYHEHGLEVKLFEQNVPLISIIAGQD